MGLATALLLGGGLAAGFAGASALNKMQMTTEAPPAVPETGEDEEDYMQRQKRRKGRAKTIITGDLTPETLGKKTLLGG
jgi:hypothetical protein